MKTPMITSRRGAVPAVLLVGGGALAAAAWIGGARDQALGLVACSLVAAAVAFRWAGGRGDVAAMMRTDADERQRSIGMEALAVTGIVMISVALIGTVVQTARNLDPGPYGTMCLVAGVTYAVSVMALRSRR
jgi:hypothetical protein